MMQMLKRVCFPRIARFTGIHGVQSGTQLQPQAAFAANPPQLSIRSQPALPVQPAAQRMASFLARPPLPALPPPLRSSRQAASFIARQIPAMAPYPQPARPLSQHVAQRPVSLLARPLQPGLPPQPGFLPMAMAPGLPQRPQADFLARLPTPRNPGLPSRRLLQVPSYILNYLEFRYASAHHWAHYLFVCCIHGQGLARSAKGSACADQGDPNPQCVIDVCYHSTCRT